MPDATQVADHIGLFGAGRVVRIIIGILKSPKDRVNCHP